MNSIKYLVYTVAVICSSLVTTGQQTSYSTNEPLLTPKMFAPGAISTELDELNACFSPDGKTIFFSVNGASNKMSIILMAEFKNGNWTTPVKAPFSLGRYNDYDPFMTADGSKIFFCSNRPAPLMKYKKPNFDIYYVEKKNGKWSDSAINIGLLINDEADQYYPSVAANGNLYFSTRKDSSFDIYCSKYVNGEYTAPFKLPGAININSPGVSEIDNCISPDERFIIFAGYGRKDSKGGGDLYISFNKNGNWTNALNLGDKANSVAREFCPILSPDGNYLFFTSSIGNFDKELKEPITSYKDIKIMFGGILNGLNNIYQVRFDKPVVDSFREASGN